LRKPDRDLPAEEHFHQGFRIFHVSSHRTQEFASSPEHSIFHYPNGLTPKIPIVALPRIHKFL
jgi:hypothetical protein